MITKEKNDCNPFIWIFRCKFIFVKYNEKYQKKTSENALHVLQLLTFSNVKRLRNKRADSVDSFKNLVPETFIFCTILQLPDE